MPEGFQPPEGAAPGESFDSVATFSWNPDEDTLCLTAIGGVSVTPATKEDAAEAKAPATDSNSSFKDAMMNSLAAGGKPPM